MSRIGTAMDERGSWPGEVVAQRLRDVRSRRGWTQQHLADRTVAIGYPISRKTIATIESAGDRARNVKLEEVFALAHALGVSPLHLIVPFDSTRLRVASRRQSVDTIMARRWLRGQDTLLDEDPAFFFSELPLDEIIELARITGGAVSVEDLGFDTKAYRRWRNTGG